jgi:hypothetical protein
MISYSEYLLEKKLEKLFESNIKFSKGFLGALNSIDTPLSKKIMSLQNNDVDIQYNYIDITDENDSVSFTPDRKAQEIIAGKEELYRVIDSGRYLTNSERNQHIYTRLNHERPESVYQPEVGTVGKVIGETTGTTGKIYCLFECTSEGGDKGKRTIINKEALEAYDASFDKVWITSRNKIKIGRVIRALLRASGVQSNDAEIEKFVNQYKSTIDIINDAFNKFDVVKSFDILHWYNYENYTYGSDKGTLGNSCMADVPDSWLYIYRANPDVCNLVILYDENGKIADGKYKSSKIIGRALLWTTRDGYKFMDRIYTAKDSDIDLFKKFADRNGWWSKRNQNSGSSFMIEKGNESKNNVPIIVDLQKWDDEFPYLDSLMYFNNGTGELSNDGESIKANYMLQSTGGGYEEIEDEDY